MTAPEAVDTGTALPVRVVVDPDGTGSAVVDEVLQLPAVPGGEGPTALRVAAVGQGTTSLFRFPAGFENDFHNAPEPSWMLFLAGRLEVTTSDGTTVVLAAGDAVRFEDVSGPGHRSRVVSDEDVLVASMPALP